MVRHPFNSTTTITYGLPITSSVLIVILDLQGRKVAKLIEREIDAGKHSVIFDPVNLVSGVYIIKLNVSGQAVTEKVVLIR